MAKESIVDASVPSAGRIYDYLLGGHHNFEVDRQAADRLVKLLPFMPRALRLQRWCLQDIAVELGERRAYPAIIDFASGLPTQDHIHTVVPPETTVVYSDYDPVVVEYAREILGNSPNVHFFEADARRPEELLNRAEIGEILGALRNVGLVFWGIGGFLTDEEIRHAAQALYDWSGPDSCWVFNAQAAGGDPDDPAIMQLLQIYEQTGSPFHVRSLERYEELIQPWRPDERGFIPLLEWHGFDKSILSAEDLKIVAAAAGGGYGAYLIK